MGNRIWRPDLLSEASGRMNCLYCGEPIAPSQSLSELEFCSDDHRYQYESATWLRRYEYVLPLAPPDLAQAEQSSTGYGHPLASGSTVIALPAVDLDPGTRRLTITRPDALRSLLGAWPFEACISARAAPEIATVPVPESHPRIPAMRAKPRGSVLAMSKAALWKIRLYECGYGLSATWRRIPRVLQVSMAAIPLVFTAAMHGWPSTPALGRAGANVQTLMKTRWGELGSHVQHRASIALADDFRKGLANWRGRSNSQPSWSFDRAGFVHPGPLALFRPTADLTDCLLEFRAQIDQQGLGFVFRARDFNNYYAVKLVIAEPGPLPTVKIVRYPVIHGREGPHAIRPLPLIVRGDTWYTVRLDVRGSDFTLNIQGQVADYWSDARLTEGGIGFFCGKDEHARLSSVAVSHQNDVLGMFCAYLKPHGSANK